MVTASDLSPWNDADDLLKSLGQLEPAAETALRDAVAALLDHADADVREEAMRRLFVTWKDRQYRDQSVEALQSDDVAEVRTVAAFAVAATSDHPSRKRDIALLLSVLDSGRENPGVRLAAYEALLILHRKPDFPSREHPFNPDRDVDWQWVGSLRG